MKLLSDKDPLRALAVVTCSDLLRPPPPARGHDLVLDLVLWRHADAEPHAAEGDMGGTLTRKGRRQAARMGAWLDEHLPGGTRVFVSPAQRAQRRRVH